MSWNRSKFNASNAAERGAAIRAQHEAEQSHAQQRREDMAGRDKSPTGIGRGRYKFDEAGAAVGSLNRKVDEAIDAVAQAFDRERQMDGARDMQRQDDSQRAPILDGHKAVR
jgi:hypothetical protein